jgi:NADPH-dependent FMN reductase
LPSTVRLLLEPRSSCSTFGAGSADVQPGHPEHEAGPPAVVGTLVEICYEADGMLWSSPMYNGSASGSFKNAIDWLHVLGAREPAYLHDSASPTIPRCTGRPSVNPRPNASPTLADTAV